MRLDSNFKKELLYNFKIKCLFIILTTVKKNFKFYTTNLSYIYLNTKKIILKILFYIKYYYYRQLFITHYYCIPIIRRRKFQKFKEKGNNL